MNIDDASKLLPGMYINCPADKGDPAYQGLVVSAAEPEDSNDFVSISVLNESNGREAVWPSNRVTPVSSLPEIQTEQPWVAITRDINRAPGEHGLWASVYNFDKTLSHEEAFNSIAEDVLDDAVVEEVVLMQGRHPNTILHEYLARQDKDQTADPTP